jgi:RNA polymerase sigma-70 factor (ECF subfamily)
MTAASSRLATTSEVLGSPSGIEGSTPAESAAVARTDGMSLREIALAYFANVWRFLRALGVPAHALDDGAQEVFLVAARKRSEIRAGAEKSFLFGAAVHVAREIRRKHAREELADDPDDESLEAAVLDTPEDSLDRKEERDLLTRLLDGLTRDLRTVFVLYELEEQSLPEIAALLGLPLGTVTSRLRRGREKFAALLQKHQIKMRGET